ncbi:MAG: diacylglycerol kinase family protein [Actinomycetota bacterium]
MGRDRGGAASDTNWWRHRADVMAFLLIANPSARGHEADLISRTRRRLGDVDVVELQPDLDLAGTVHAAVEDGRVVIVAGGDGTVNAVVQHLGPAGVLAVLPAGRMNHFARDLGIHDDDVAIQALVRGVVRRIDLGRCGQRWFVNNAAVGLYPEILREREERAGRVGHYLAQAGAAIRAVRSAAPVTGVVTADGDARSLEAWAVFVGNNDYEASGGRIGRRDRLDAGALDLWLLRLSPGPAGRRALALLLLRDRTWGSRVVRTRARRVELRLDAPRHFALDGELHDRIGSLEIELVPGALNVVAP